MTTTTDTCWADPLTRKERAELAWNLAGACLSSHANAEAALHRNCDSLSSSLRAVADEMADLRIDVTERAAVPPEVAERQNANAGRESGKVHYVISRDTGYTFCGRHATVTLRVSRSASAVTCATCLKEINHPDRPADGSTVLSEE